MRQQRGENFVLETIQGVVQIIFEAVAHPKGLRVCHLIHIEDEQLGHALIQTLHRL